MTMTRAIHRPLPVVERGTEAMVTTATRSQEPPVEPRNRRARLHTPKFWSLRKKFLRPSSTMVTLLLVRTNVPFVCLDLLDDPTDNATVGVCGHKFHLSCIIQSAQEKNHCPCCRVVFTSISNMNGNDPIPIQDPSKRQPRLRRTSRHRNSA
jgi:Zinc finger, C3HC4 type (RING finger)